jgi:hypothetical protein
LLRLKDFEAFKQVRLSEHRTLEWANLPIEITFKGQNQSYPLELDPDVLYENSRLIRQMNPFLSALSFAKLV